MDQNSRLWDASPLIGLVLAIPALFYLSFWWRQDWGYLRHALPAKALVYWIQVVDEGRNGQDYYTWVYFRNQAGQLTQGMLYDAHPWADVFDEIDIYYRPDLADVRFGGPRGIWGGLYLALGTLALGAALSFIAARAARRRPQPAADASLEEVEALRDEWDP